MSYPTTGLVSCSQVVADEYAGNNSSDEIGLHENRARLGVSPCMMNALFGLYPYNKRGLVLMAAVHGCTIRVTVSVLTGVLLSSHGRIRRKRIVSVPGLLPARRV